MLENVWKPLSRRLGSIIAGGIITAFAITDPTLAGYIEASVISLTVLGADLVLSANERKRGQR
jgi:hypothetical protein